MSDDLLSGVPAVAAMIADSEDEADSAWLAQIGHVDPPIGQPFNGMEPGEWTPDHLGLPPECPVMPLGVDGDRFHFLDTIGQLRTLKAGEFGQAHINALFMGRTRFLYWAWPRWDGPSSNRYVKSWRPEIARQCLMDACAQKGAWDAVDRARGRGAWSLPAPNRPHGELIYHCGDVVWKDGKSQRALGEINGDVYMTRPPIPRPWSKPLTGQPGPALELVPLLRSWNWARPDVDPILFLGFLGAAIVGGALEWRPTVFITGDKATGKSTLQRLLRQLLGGGLIQTENTTEAGISQLLKMDALPVSIDELEGEADTRQAKNIVKLARISASGGLRLRGGDNHTGTQFRARSCFAFSSINQPPLEPQDLSRMALLRLYRLPAGATPPVLDPQRNAMLGRMLMRRLADGWHLYDATLQAIREMLARAGHDGRGQDTFGHLLACADLCVGHDAERLGLALGAETEFYAEWEGLLAAPGMTEYEDAEENWRLCLRHMLSVRVDAWRHGSKRQTVGDVLDALWRGLEEFSFEAARSMLQQTGLTLQRPAQAPATLDYDFCIPNQHPLLHELMRGSKWQGEQAAGAWSLALRQGPKAEDNDGQGWRVAQAWVNGQKAKCTAFPLSFLMRDAPANGTEYQS